MLCSISQKHTLPKKKTLPYSGAGQVVDIRKYYETAEVLRERVVHYLKEYSKHMEEEPSFSVDNKTEGVMEAELNAALESVFPRKGFLYWMDLANDEKVLQLEELAEVVVGIRIFNKHVLSSSSSSPDLLLPFEQPNSFLGLVTTTPSLSKSAIFHCVCVSIPHSKGLYLNATHMGEEKIQRSKSVCELKLAKFFSPWDGWADI